MGKLLAGLSLAFLLGAAPDKTIPTPFPYTFSVVPLVGCLNGSGSGVRVSDDIVITAKHVSDNLQCRIGFVPLAVVHEGPKDFAALRGELPNGFRATVNCDGIETGKTYFAVGYAFGEEQVMQPLLGTNQYDEGYRRMRGRVFPGMSGGPVVNSDGAVVAITVRYHKMADWAWVYELKDTYLCSAN